MQVHHHTHTHLHYTHEADVVDDAAAAAAADAGNIQATSPPAGHSAEGKRHPSAGDTAGAEEVSQSGYISLAPDEHVHVVQEWGVGQPSTATQSDARYTAMADQ